VTQVDGGNTAKYNYDAFGNRAMQYAPPVYNEYVVDLTGRAITAIKPGTSTVYTAEVFAGGRHWVTDNGSALFLGADWVGTSRALTNLGGTFDQLYTSLPWGDGLSFAGGSSLHTTSQYTGKEFDSETGLYHFPARQYAPVQGRWLTPDPAGVAAMNIANPQTWNRYSYVTNNPVTRTDPSGLLTGGGGGGPCDVGDCGGGDPCQFGLCGPSGPCDFTGDCGGGPCDVGDCGGSQGVPPGGRTNPPAPNSIFSGQDCLFCFPLGPSPLQILQAVLSGNLAGALQDLGAIPTDAINCESGACQINPITDALGLGIPPLVDPKVAFGNYGAGSCIADGIQMRKFPSKRFHDSPLGCVYFCEVITGDPLVDPLTASVLGVGHFKGSQIDAACGPGTFCPLVLTIEVEPPIGPFMQSNANILSCWP